MILVQCVVGLGSQAGMATLVEVSHRMKEDTSVVSTQQWGLPNIM